MVRLQICERAFTRDAGDAYQDSSAYVRSCVADSWSDAGSGVIGECVYRDSSQAATAGAGGMNQMAGPHGAANSARPGAPPIIIVIRFTRFVSRVDIPV